MQEIRDDSDILLSVIDNVFDTREGLFFYGKEIDYLQVAAFNYVKGRKLLPHRHIDREGPSIVKSQEVLIIFRGSVEFTIYDTKDIVVYTGILYPGDFCITYNGGCGKVILEEGTLMLEAKNGPFLGSDLDRVLL